MDAAAVRAGVAGVLEGADRLDEIRWPTMPSDAMPGSEVERAAASPAVEDRLAAVVAHMRTWSVASLASVGEVERADAHQVGRLGAPR